MKSKLCVLLSAVLLGWGSTIAFQAQSAEIDFEGLPMGTIVDELSSGAGITGNVQGVIRVFGLNFLYDDPTINVAVIFDSSCPVTPLSFCGPADVDLGTPNETFGGPGIGDGGEAGSPYQNDVARGNVLILSHTDLLIDSNNDGLVDDPTDADDPGFVNFDFSDIGKGKNKGTVTINSVTLMDVELEEHETPALIVLSGPGIITSTFAINDMGNNGVITFDQIGISGVSNMRINVKGSSSIVSAFFDESRAPRACWITTGGFQNAGVASGGKDFTFGGNVGPPPSGSWEVIDHNTKDNFHSNDVSIVNCVEIPGTGPGQPGGKKGFTINQAFFQGTGRLNGVGGFPFDGYVIDRGEPSGKNGNQKDEFNIVVRDPNTNAVVFEASGELDGGNVQIHPPVGKN